jgi:hypothetical protein
MDVASECKNTDTKEGFGMKARKELENGQTPANLKLRHK